MEFMEVIGIQLTRTDTYATVMPSLGCCWFSHVKSTYCAVMLDCRRDGRVTPALENAKMLSRIDTKHGLALSVFQFETHFSTAIRQTALELAWTPDSRTADCAAANRATGTRNGEHET